MLATRCPASNQSKTRTNALPATSIIEVSGARIQIDYSGLTPDLPASAIEQHICAAAQAVATYYGRFPVPAVRIVVIITPGAGVLQGTTWGDMQGLPAVTRLRIGQHTTTQDLNADWIATHELVHTALASLPDDQHWLEEGIATYVEPIARAQAGQLASDRVWRDMVNGMAHGEPEPGDRGLDRTHTWGRTYWGGALFCLVADVEIRKQTGNARGLQDALRGVVAGGGTIDKEWPVDRVLALADRATGTNVLTRLYTEWSKAPVEVNLPALWTQLGISEAGGKLTYDDTAPLAKARIAITAPTHP